MARNKPVAIWVIKHRPKREPKFHKVEMLAGVGRSTKAPFAILNRGCVFRMGVVIYYERRSGPKKVDLILTTTNSVKSKYKIIRPVKKILW